ncbi:hypothetical protein LINPERHAP2_LOCUS11527 [Linum perenne]
MRGRPNNSFRPRPPLPTQSQSNANPAAPGTSQGFPANPSQGNPPNMFQNSAPMQSSQMGGVNPQSLNNGQFMPNNNMPPPMMMMMPQQQQQHPGPFNAPMMMNPQLNPGFLPPPNMGSPMYMNQQMNFQQQGQLVLQLASLVQQLSQSGGLLNMPNPMQNVNPSMLPLQMPNPNIFPNQMFGAGQQPNPNQQNFMMQQQQQQQPMGTNMSNSLPAASQLGLGSPSAIQQRPGNPSATQRILQPQSPHFPGQQGGNVAGMPQNSNTNSQWGNSARNDFQRHTMKDCSQPGNHNSQFHPNDNRKRKFESKGRGHERQSKFGGDNPATPSQAAEKKRTHIPNYPEHEVKQWRELRKKNYPTKCNVDKKQALKLADAEAIEKEAKMRREQLKEVLAKQAELGVEVAEVPSYYLLDSEKQVNHRDRDNRWQKKKGKFQQKRERRNNKRGQQLGGNQATASHNSSASNMKEPTLLQKLLSTDIKRDNQRLLQSFRFMTTNSFFKDWPEKPLSFPKVVIKEDGIETTVVEEEASCEGKPEEVNDETGSESFQVMNTGNEEDHGDDDDHEEEQDDVQQQMKPGASFIKEIVVTGEEGEIIN